MNVDESASGELVERDHAVGVLVVVRVSALPVAEERIARLVARRRAHLRRQRTALRVDTESEKLVGVRRSGQRDVEPEALSIEQLRGQQSLEPGILHRTEVRALRRVAGSEIGRNDRADQRVFRDLAVVREIERQTASEEARVEPALELIRALRAQVLIAE